MTKALPKAQVTVLKHDILLYKEKCYALQAYSKVVRGCSKAVFK
jgi:hypothetical protein